MNNNIKFINAVIATYFTSFSYKLYKDASNHGNMAYAGVGLGLINARIIFWCSNMIFLALLYLKNDLNIYFNYSIFLLCLYLYGISLYKIKYLMRFIG